MFAKMLSALVLAATVFGANSIAAAAPTQKSVEAVNAEKVQLKGKQVSVKGKVVKVNNNVMKKNFLHIQDGTGKEGTNDLTVTSTQSAQVGDEVVVTGTVALDRDFGSGYMYPLIVEEATIKNSK